MKLLKMLVKAAGLPLFLGIVDCAFKQWNCDTFLPTTNNQIKKSLKHPGGGDVCERGKERQVWNREKKHGCVCVCVYERGWGLWRETTVNYAFTHHITGQLKLEQSCVNRVKTNRLNSLQDRKVWTRAAIPHAARQINYSAFVNSTAVSLICIMGPRYRPHFPMQTWRLNAALLRSVFREWCFSLHQ